MSVGYVAVQWNRHKRVYDGVVAACIVLYLGMFVFVGKLMYRGVHAVSDEVLALRALGSCAFLMLTFVLCIGPLARIDRRFLPVLYNRRHLGVATFMVAMVHGLLAVGYYHGFGNINPLVSLLSTNTHFTSLRAFPFQLLGAAALCILFLMAATSHDFWNRNLSARVWKWLHMLVYPAYALVVLHVALGALQAQRSWWLASAILLCVALVGLLHVAASRKGAFIDRGTALLPLSPQGERLGEGWCSPRRPSPQPSPCQGEGVPGQPTCDSNGALWLDAGCVDEIEEGRGRTVCASGGERIAVFRHEGTISATTNVCAHQGGPLGEGRIIDGCVTCPWHGWTYRPHDGQAPPPFSEKIPTHRVRLEGRRIFVDLRPLPPGTPVPPARIEGHSDA